MRLLLITSILLLGIICIFLGTKYKNISFFPSKAPLPISQQVKGTSDNTRSFTTTVSRVIDGDTVEIKGGQGFRYIGINAPESNQPYGREAKEYNQSIVLGKSVRVVFDAQKKDQYGRILGYVYRGAIFVNEEMLKKGWAITEPLAPNTIYKQEFGQAEKIAHETCQGLWSDTCMPQTNSCMKIATIHSDAAGVDDRNLNDEWVELVNDCPTTVDLSGWLLKDSSAENAYTFAAISLVPQQSIRLYSGCGINTSSSIYWQCPPKPRAVWNNSGDEAMLFDTHGKLLSVYKY